MAKRILDNKSFYGGVLHVCYAPERESLEDTRAKLLQRSKDVLSRLYGTLEKDYNHLESKKRKHEEEFDVEEPESKIGKTVEPVVVYGPQLPENYHKEESSVVFNTLPTVSNSKIEKKIVFRNK